MYKIYNYFISIFLFSSVILFAFLTFPSFSYKVQPSMHRESHFIRKVNFAGGNQFNFVLNNIPQSCFHKKFWIYSCHPRRVAGRIQSEKVLIVITFGIKPWRNFARNFSKRNQFVEGLDRLRWEDIVQNENASFTVLKDLFLSCFRWTRWTKNQ